MILDSVCGNCQVRSCENGLHEALRGATILADTKWGLRSRADHNKTMVDRTVCANADCAKGFLVGDYIFSRLLRIAAIHVSGVQSGLL